MAESGYIPKSFAAAAVPALRAALKFARRELAVVLDSNCARELGTGVLLRETLDPMAADQVALIENHIQSVRTALLESGPGAGALVEADEQATPVDAAITPMLAINPDEYGVTVTADVIASSPEAAPEAFRASLGIGNPEGLTYHVEQLATGRRWEFDE